jgi:hypothetical protein
MFAGLLILAAAVLGVASHVWLSRSVLVPMAGERIEYLFVSATNRSLLAIASVTALLMLVAHLLIRRDAARHGVQPPLFSWGDTAYLAPLCWFAVTPLALLNLIPSVSRSFSVASYAIVDLRWWWTALVVGWVAWRVEARVRRRNHLRPPDHLRPPHRATSVPAGGTEVGGTDFARRHRWIADAALAALAVVWTVTSTPLLRTLGGAIGDEPKYLRYCENWYQGLGVDIAQIRPMAELPVDFRPQLVRNLALLVETVPGELRSLASDAARFVGDPSHQFNRARHTGLGFVAGKDGGAYQMHNPGLSLVMFPAYYLDRRLAPIVPGSRAQWPDHLPIVNALMVGVYAAWTVLIFRFLRKCGASDGVAWIVALTSTFTLPAAAFPFQYYPELVAGLVVTVVAGHLLFTGIHTRRVSFVFGLLAGYLPWLHVRFSAVTMVFAVAALVIWRADRRRGLAFVSGVALPVALLSLYTYRISGSIVPSALWTASGDEENFVWSGMVKNTVGYLIDRDWGLFAHSPVFLLALPGYWWMAKRKPAVVWLIAAVTLALLLPAAGKTLVQTTPMRLIVAVVPLAATPLIEVLMRRDRALRIAFVLLLILSLDNALAYDFHHDRLMDILVDPSFSGWKVNLLFPERSRQPWQVSAANGTLLVCWLAALAAMVTAPAWMRRWAPRADGGSGRIGSLVCAAAILFVLLGTGVSAATGTWTWRKYLITPAEAARQAALFLDDLRACTICYSSTDGPIGRKDANVGAQRLLAHLDSVDPTVAARHAADWHTPDYSEWLAMPGHIRDWYREATGRDPSNGEVGHLLYQWREEHVSSVEIRRRIFAAAGKTP